MNGNHAKYLPQPEERSPWQLDVSGAGFASIKPHQDYPQQLHPEGHYFEWDRGRILPEYQILFISKGKGVVETETTGSRSFVAPFVFLLFPGTWHRYRPDRKTGWNEHWFAFDGAYPRGLQRDEAIHPSSPFFDLGHYESTLAQIQLIHDEVRSEALGYRAIIATAIIQILALSTSLPRRQKEESLPIRNAIRKACFIMRDRAHEALSPEAIAAELNLGYTYFRRMFKQYTGLSPMRYHTQLRLERAKRLLLQSDLNITEISEALQFDTPFHFSNWFKKHTERSPSAWKEIG